MRHRVWYRSVAAILALWFPLIIAEPAVLHTCPVHSATMAMGGTAAGMAHMDMHSAGPESQDGLPAQGHDHTRCTCIGDCSAGGIAAGLPALRLSLVAVTVRRIEGTLPTGDTRAVVPPPFTLPFANGPPGVLSLV